MILDALILKTKRTMAMAKIKLSLQKLSVKDIMITGTTSAFIVLLNVIVPAKKSKQLPLHSTYGNIVI